MKMLDVPQSGSIGGVTSSHNRAGQYKRARRAPVSPTRTDKQGVARSRFGAASALWQSMTTTLQAAWTAFAHSYPVVDSLGQTVVLTGQQYFVGLNAQLLACGLPTSTVIPTNTTMYPVGTPALYADAGGNVIATVGTIITGDFNKVSCSSVKSNGVSFNAQFSLFGVISSTNVVADISAPYVAQYGNPGLGRKIFANFVYVNSSGMSSNDNIISAAVVAASVVSPPALVAQTGHALQSTGPGTGALAISFFVVNADGSGSIVGTTTQLAGVASQTVGVIAGKSYYTRAFAGGVWQNASNVVIAVA